MRDRIIGLGLGLVAIGGAQAQPAPQPLPDRYQKVVECSRETDPARRLACMDAAIAEAEKARRSGDLVITDRAGIEATERREFGLSREREAQRRAELARSTVRDLRTTVVAARLRPYEREWVIALADGSVWRQTGSDEIFRKPKPGLPVEVTRGVLGSFFLVVDGATAIRVRRVK